ncbi:MAG TPA: glycosyltransferase family 39 protein [Polyangiaceae bacterium]|nr:glycosyltransferase family 39 protein [Polyangiaceae bacterium]
MRSTPSASGSQHVARWFWSVVGVCFAVFSLNFRELGLSDTVPATLLAASIVRDFDLSLDEFQPLLDEPAQDPRTTLRRQLDWTLATRIERGHLRSSYPIGAAILAAPVFVIPAALGSLHHLGDYREVGKVAASLIAALSAGFVFLCLLRFVDRRTAALLSILYALGTSVWTIASQALWQHGPALLCLSVATWAALRLVEKDSAKDAALLSAALGMAIVCRPQNVPSSALLGLFALVSRPKRAAYLILPAAVIGALLVAYDVHAFGNASGGYEALYGAPAHAWRHLTARSALSMPLGEGLASVLLSPSRGLFVYSPVLLAGVVGLALASVRLPLARFLLAWVVVTFVFYGKNLIWWGGTSYGPRYMTELSLPLVLGIAMIWDRIRRHRAALVALAAASAFSVAVQFVGAFTWECGWHTEPYWVDFRPDRLWDVHDPEILRCANVLVEKGARAPEFGPFARAPRPRPR